MNIISSVKKEVGKIALENEVILFGSRARGEHHQDSDWDILILTTYKSNLKDEQQYRHKLLELEIEYGEAFSTFVYSKMDWNHKYQITPFYQQIKKDGIKL